MFLLQATKITVNVFISISAEIIWSILRHHFFLHTDVHLTRKKMCLPLTGRSEDHLPKRKKKKGFPEKLLIGVEPIQPHSSVVSQRKICFWTNFKQTRFQCLAPNPGSFDICLIYTRFTLPPKTALCCLSYSFGLETGHFEHTYGPAIWDLICGCKRLLAEGR